MVSVVTLVAHVFFATLAFGFVIVGDFVLSAVAASRDPRAIRVAYGVAQRAGPMVGPLFGLAILLGFTVALERGESLLSPWLSSRMAWSSAAR
jgi:hypothetical protein